MVLVVALGVALVVVSRVVLVVVSGVVSISVTIGGSVAARSRGCRRRLMWSTCQVSRRKRRSNTPSSSTRLRARRYLWSGRPRVFTQPTRSGLGLRLARFASCCTGGRLTIPSVVAESIPRYLKGVGKPFDGVLPSRRHRGFRVCYTDRFGRERIEKNSIYIYIPREVDETPTITNQRERANPDPSTYGEGSGEVEHMQVSSSQVGPSRSGIGRCRGRSL